MDSLKLVALETDDLPVIAAHVQDAVLKVGDIDWRPREKRLVIALNRFAWEREGKVRGHERRRAVLHLARVEAVRAARIRQDQPEGVLSLLTLRFEAGEAPGGRVLLDFAGGGQIAVEVECLEVSLSDLGAAWSTDSLPRHDGV